MAPLIDVGLAGSEDAGAYLERIDRRLGDPPGRILRQIGELQVDAFAANLRSQGARVSGRGVSWPELKPATRADRARRGFPPDGPALIRTGELVDSITILDVGTHHVTTGPTASYAPFVHGARPFNLPSLGDVDRWVARLADHYFPEGG